MTRKPVVWLAAVLGAVVVISFGAESKAAPKGGAKGFEAPSAITLLAQAKEPGPRLSAEYIVNTVRAAGFEDVSRIAFEHNRYEVKTFDPRRARTVEVFIDPKTRKLIKDPKTGKVMMHLVATATKPGKKASAVSFVDIMAKVKAEGFVDVYSIEYEHAMYEIQAHDDQGRRVELFYIPKRGDLLRHPKTGKARFEILK